jgi:murein DD-endopeptidase MepM/ murein hydrolase activator NlpD
MRLHPSTWFWGSMAGLVLLMAMRFEFISQRTAAVQEPPAEQSTLQASAPPFVGPLLLEPEDRLAAAAPAAIEDTLGRGDSIYLSLRRHGVAEQQITRLTQAMRKVFAPRSQSRPADYYTLTLDAEGLIQTFLYTPHREPERPILVAQRAGDLVARRLELPLLTQRKIIEVRIEDNLANAIRTASEGDALTDALADNIFGAVIDFQLDPRQGDRLLVLVEKLYKDDQFVRYGRVLLAQYLGQQVTQLGVYYQASQGEGYYYDGQGQSLGRMFLLKPLSFRRISSRFNHRRFHPILKRSVPHLGTDYAAAVGTPVWATSRGRVTHAGWKGGYGKLVEIAHANGYRTRYAHLSRILVKAGQQVQQQQVVGKVGTTGRSTGPHLHYEILKEGRHINPENANKGFRGQPLDKQYLAAFGLYCDALLEELEKGLPQPRSPVLAGGVRH